LTAQILGKPVRIRFEAAAIAVAPVQVEKAPAEESDLRRRALSHPGVKRFQELFPEAQVRAVRNLSE
ncbi:MAG: DNA polymerase III subunit gamma/tau, partial [Bryobacteraceae bacterium]